MTTGEPAYITLVCVVAVVVSAVVYLFLGSFERALSSLFNTLTIVQNADGQYRQQMRAEALARLIFRALALVGWVLYSLLFAAFLVPAFVALFSSGIADLSHVDWLALFTAYGALWIALHAHVVFARLLCLRPRLFGGADVIVAGLE